MTARHEPLAAVVDEHRAFAADGLGNQRQRGLGSVERRGMELHEFHISEPDARAVRDSKPVTRGDLRVGGVAVDLPAPTRGKHGRVGDDLEWLPRETRAQPDAPPALHDQRERARALEYGDGAVRAHALDQRPGHLGAGLVAVRVHDALTGMRGLLRELEPAVGLAVEARPNRREVADALRAFSDEHGDCIGIA